MATNSLFALLSYSSGVILAFFLSPFIFRQLGDARYGVWALFGEVLSYYGLLDLGIRGAVNYYVGRSLAGQQSDAVPRYISSAFAGLACVSSFAALLGIGAVFLLQNTLVADSVNRVEVLSAATLFIVLFCIGLPVEVFSAVLVGSRRARLVSSAEITARFVSAGAMYLGLVYAPSLLVLAFAQLLGRLGYWALIRRHIRRYVPEARLSFAAMEYSTWKELFGYGGQNAFLNLSWLLLGRKDATLITLMLGPSWVAIYTFARLLIVSVSDLCSAVTQSLRPNLVYHWARNEFEQAYTIYYTGTRYSSFLALSAGVFFLVFGKSFIVLWIGERFVTGPITARTDIILYILLAAHLPRMMHSMSWQLLFAANKQKPFMAIAATEAVVNIGLAVVLVRQVGVVGVAIATMIQMLISYLIVMPLLLPRLVGVNLRRYVTEGIGRSVLGGIGLGAASLVIRQLAPANSWPTLLLDTAVFGAIAIVAALSFVIRPEDRLLLFQRIAAITTRIRARAKIALAS